MRVLEVYDRGGSHRMRNIPKEMAVAQNAVKYNHRFYSTSHHDNYVPPGPRVASIAAAVTTDNALADGVATNVVTFTAHNDAGAAVPSAALFITVAAPAVAVPSGQAAANASGVVTVNIHTSTPGPVEVVCDGMVGGATVSATCTFAAPAAGDQTQAPEPAPEPPPPPVEEPVPTDGAA